MKFVQNFEVNQSSVGAKITLELPLSIAILPLSFALLPLSDSQYYHFHSQYYHFHIRYYFLALLSHCLSVYRFIRVVYRATLYSIEISSTSSSDGDPEERESLTGACVTHIDETLEKLGVKSTMHINNPVLCKLKKDDMAVMFRVALSLLDGLTCMISIITCAPRGVTVELIEAKRKIISLQSELLVCKEKKLDSVKFVVQTSVCEIMKEEIKSFGWREWHWNMEAQRNHWVSQW